MSNEYNITRLCSSINNNLEYHLILEYFETKYNPEKINISLNKRWNSIIEYEKYGFKLLKETNPNKIYFKVNENKLFIDSGENEEEMLRNNYRVIFDYGNLEMSKLIKD